MGLVGGKKDLSTINEEDEFLFNNSRSVGSNDRSELGLGSAASENFSETEERVSYNQNQKI